MSKIPMIRINSSCWVFDHEGVRSVEDRIENLLANSQVLPDVHDILMLALKELKNRT